MANQNLFEAIERTTGQQLLESDLAEILNAVEKDKPFDHAEQNFYSLVETMRTAQRQYFRFAKAGSTDQKNKYLKESKAIETRVDEIIYSRKMAQLDLFKEKETPAEAIERFQRTEREV